MDTLCCGLIVLEETVFLDRFWFYSPGQPQLCSPPAPPARVLELQMDTNMPNSDSLLVIKTETQSVVQTQWNFSPDGSQIEGSLPVPASQVL